MEKTGDLFSAGSSSDEGEQKTLKSAISTILEVTLDDEDSPHNDDEREKAVEGRIDLEDHQGLLEKEQTGDVQERRRCRVQTSSKTESSQEKGKKRKNSLTPNLGAPKRKGRPPKIKSSSESEPVGTCSPDFYEPIKQVGFNIKQERISLSPPPISNSLLSKREVMSPSMTGAEIAEKFRENPAFIPEGWYFFAIRRRQGTCAGKFDQYYVTDRGAKLRSRQDVGRWIKSHHKDWDFNDFFLPTRNITLFLENGILKYVNEFLVTFAATLEESSPQEFLEKLQGLGYLRPRIKENESTHDSSKLKSPPKSRKGIQSDKEVVCNIKSKKLKTKTTPLKPTVSTNGRCKSRSPSPVKAKVKRTMAKTPVSLGVEEIETSEPVRIKRKLTISKSPYFSFKDNLPEKPISVNGLRREKDCSDAPPRSPFNLIQEDLFHDPWQMLTATIFLNCTSGKMAVPLAMEFLTRWPTPQEACRANFYDMLDVVEQLGLGRTRVAILIRFSHDFLTKNWKYPKELFGIGKYGDDSYRIFCKKNDWKRVETDDPMLMMYLNWRRATEHLRKRFRDFPGDTNAVDPDDLPLELQCSASVT